MFKLLWFLHQLDFLTVIVVLIINILNPTYAV